MESTLPPAHYAVGREVLVIYVGEDRWHTRLLIMKGTPAQMRAVTGESHHGGPIWWICTNHLDVYPEEIAVTPNITGLRGLATDGSVIRAAQVGTARYLRQVLEFIPPRPAEWVIMVAAVEKAAKAAATGEPATGSGGGAAEPESGLGNLADADPANPEKRGVGCPCTRDRARCAWTSSS